MYRREEVLSYCQEEDVSFIRLVFCDLAGRQKNISILPSELERAFEYGISFDASAIDGFTDEVKSDLFLIPDPSTLSVVPWRSVQDRVIMMFCNIYHPDGTPFCRDSRMLLKKAVEFAKERGVSCSFGSEFEFYLFETDENGYPTRTPLDRAGYMDSTPEDRGENVRRNICLTLSEMGIQPESSHHEEGPGQNEIDFRYGDTLTAADNAVIFKSVAQNIAMQDGLYADFSPKPLARESGNGLHINVSVKSSQEKNVQDPFIEGVLRSMREITAYLNTMPQSYLRLGEKKAPRYITWSSENRSQLIRIPAAKGAYRRFELRSPDPMTNPYLAYALILYAGMEGVQNNYRLRKPLDENLFQAAPAVTSRLDVLPATLEEARLCAAQSELIKRYMPEILIG